MACHTKISQLKFIFFKKQKRKHSLVQTLYFHSWQYINPAHFHFWLNGTVFKKPRSRINRSFGVSEAAVNAANGSSWRSVKSEREQEPRGQQVSADNGTIVLQQGRSQACLLSRHMPPDNF